MVVSEDYFNSNLVSKYFQSNKMIALKVTNECPVGCAHCRENASPSNKGVITKNVVDEIIKQITDAREEDKWIICLQGGDALVYPDTCKYIIDKCNSIGIATNLYTSGWWYEDENLMKQILQWKPSIFCLSVNDWTIEKLGGIEYANKIAKNFLPNDTPIIIYSEVFLDKPKYYSQLEVKSCCISYNLAPVGRAYSLIGTYKAAGKEENWMKQDYCVLSGFEIGIDGTIWPNCCAASAGSCIFGSIFDRNIVELSNHKRGLFEKCMIDLSKPVQSQRVLF